MERGRVKCHQYWPTNGETLDMGQEFTVKCFNEHADETGSFVFRDLMMSDGKTGETRTIQHMQYLAWPGELAESLESSRTNQPCFKQITAFPPIQSSSLPSPRKFDLLATRRCCRRSKRH
jgi:protein tyrosine phosphatase